MRDLVEAAVAGAASTGHPVPTFYSVTDPLHRPAELAVVLAKRWAVPRQLLPAYDALVARKVAATGAVPPGALLLTLAPTTGTDPAHEAGLHVHVR